MEEKKRKAVYDREAQLRYQSKLAAVTFRLKPETLDRYKAAAQERGYSLRAFVLEAIEEKMNRQGGD